MFIDPMGLETILNSNFEDLTGTELFPEDNAVYLQTNKGLVMISNEAGNEFYFSSFIDHNSTNPHMQWAAAIDAGQISFYDWPNDDPTPRFSLRGVLKAWVLEGATCQRFQVNATTNRTHSPGSPHYSMRAVDIQARGWAGADDLQWGLLRAVGPTSSQILGPEFMWGRRPVSPRLYGTHTNHIHVGVR